MKKSLKISKKVLSVVLSVLMVMSVFVFAPAASAAEEQPKATLKVTVKVTDDIRLSDTVSHPYGEYLRLVITETNGKVHTYDMLTTLIGKGLISSGTYIEDGKTYSTSVTITSSVASIKVDPKFKTYYIDKAVVAVSGNATYTAQYTEPRSMDDVKEAIDKANDIIGNDDYYKEDQKKVEDAKKELEDYLDEVGVDLDKNQNPIEKGSPEDAKITELVEKLNDAINGANKNRDERENTKKNMDGFMGWLVRLLILVRHLLGMVG